jgi:hypothetical protein
MLKAHAAQGVAFFAALAIFGAINVAAYFVMSANPPRIEKEIFNLSADRQGSNKPWSWWLARKYLELGHAPDVVLLGSSQMGSAVCTADAQYTSKVVDALTYRKAVVLQDEISQGVGHPIEVFNLASPGAMASDAYLASRALFQPGLRPKVVIIGVSPRDFIDNTMPYPAATGPFKFFSKYASPGDLLSDSYCTPMGKVQLLNDWLPTRRLGSELMSMFAGKQENSTPKTRQAANVLAAISGAGDAIPGAWPVPANIPNVWVDNTREYKNRYHNGHPELYDVEMKYFQAFLSAMDQSGVRVVVVAMPSLPMNRALLSLNFWREFKETLSANCKTYNACWLDLSDSSEFEKSDYLDTVHLNARGGLKLFPRIAAYTTTTPIVASQLRPSSTASTGTLH